MSTFLSEDAMKKLIEIWPWDTNFTVTLFLPLLFWLGFLAGWLGAEGLR